MQNLLSIMVFLPLIAAVILVLFLRGDDAMAQLNAKMVALVASGATALCAGFVLADLDPNSAAPQLLEERAWVLGVSYKFAVDGLNMPFILLICALTPLIILANWELASSVKQQMIAILCAQTMLLGAALAQNAVLFYGFFDGLLVPLFLLVGLGQGRARAAAALRFALFYLVSSAALLLAIVALNGLYGSSDFSQMQAGLPRVSTVELFGFKVPQVAIAGSLFIGLGLRMALWPFLGWVRAVHLQGSMAGGAMICALVAPMAGYGLLRLGVGAVPQGWVDLAPYALWSGAISVFATACFVTVQRDLRCLVATLIAAQIATALVGLAAINRAGLDSAMITLIAQGGSAGIALILVHRLTWRLEEWDMSSFGGLMVRNKRMALLMLLTFLIAIGLPGGAPFIGAFLTLFASYEHSLGAVVLVALGLIICAALALHVFNTVMGGDLVKSRLKSMNDFSLREVLLILGPLAILVMLGCAPMLLLDLSAAALDVLASRIGSFAPIGGL